MGVERRKHKRVDCNFPIRMYLQDHAKPIDGEVRNLSIGGAFVIAKEKIIKGSHVLLEFRQADLPMIHARIEEEPVFGAKFTPNMAQSSVARWVQQVSGTGVGLEFINPRPEVLEFLTQIISMLNKDSSG